MTELDRHYALRYASFTIGQVVEALEGIADSVPSRDGQLLTTIESAMALATCTQQAIADCISHSQTPEVIRVLMEAKP